LRISRVWHGYTAGQEIRHRTRTRKNRTRNRYGYIPYRKGYGVVQNLQYHWYPRVRTAPSPPFNLAKVAHASIDVWRAFCEVMWVVGGLGKQRRRATSRWWCCGEVVVVVIGLVILIPTALAVLVTLIVVVLVSFVVVVPAANPAPARTHFPGRLFMLIPTRSVAPIPTRLCSSLPIRACPHQSPLIYADPLPGHARLAFAWPLFVLVFGLRLGSFGLWWGSLHALQPLVYVYIEYTVNTYMIIKPLTLKA
jgi:hypothetical protein